MHLAGMPNLRKNPFSTDFYRLFQSTAKNRFMAESTDFFEVAVFNSIQFNSIALFQTQQYSMHTSST